MPETLCPAHPILSPDDGEDHVNLVNHKKVDLKPLVSQPHPAGSLSGIGNGQQSVIVAVVGAAGGGAQDLDVPGRSRISQSTLIAKSVCSNK